MPLKSFYMKLRALLVAAQSFLCEAVQARRGVIRFLYLVADLTEAMHAMHWRTFSPESIEQFSSVFQVLKINLGYFRVCQAACRERRWELLTQHGSRFAESFATENPCLGQEERGHVFSQNLDRENTTIRHHFPLSFSPFGAIQSDTYILRLTHVEGFGYSVENVNPGNEKPGSLIRGFPSRVRSCSWNRPPPHEIW